jgi:diguanylate cyclase (GGDEF)-like protein
MPHFLIDNKIKLSGFVDGNPVATFIIDAGHRVVCWNKACEALTGIAAERVIGTQDHWRAFYATERPTMADLILDGGKEADIQYFYLDKFRPSLLINGACEAEDFFADFGDKGRWLHFTAAPIMDDRDRVVGAIETLQDITERRCAETALRDKEAFVSQVVESNSVPTMVIDSEHRITHWNRACEALTGLQADSVRFSRDHWHPSFTDARPFLADLVLDGAIEADFHRFYRGNLRKSTLVDGAFEAEEFVEGADGGGKWLFFTATALRSRDGSVIGAIETMQDVTERRLAEASLRESEERYRQLSLTDSLTQLSNARQFNLALAQELERSARYRRPLTLLIVDVDDFKQVNDTWGHAEGDRVLQALAGVIQSSLRQTDSAYRYGGEEFAVLMPETDAAAGVLFGERLRLSYMTSSPVLSCGKVLNVSISIGVTEYCPGDDAHSLFCRADDGMYQAKRLGKNCVVVVEPPSGP